MIEKDLFLGTNWNPIQPLAVWRNAGAITNNSSGTGELDTNNNISLLNSLTIWKHSHQSNEQLEWLGAGDADTVRSGCWQSLQETLTICGKDHIS